MTLLTPILIAAVYIIPILIATQTESVKTVQVIDESGMFKDKFKEQDELKYKYTSMSLDEGKKRLLQEEFNALAYIPKDIVENPKGLKIYSSKNVTLSLQGDIENSIEKEIENIKLQKAGIDRKVLEESKVNVSAETYSLTEEGEKDSSSGAATAVGLVAAFILYISVFIYGTQVMRGVMEEKMNRIVEVIVSSVKPFQLMLGKIIGVALVGLTQFVLWIILTTAINTATMATLGINRFQAQVSQVQKQQEKAEKLGQKNVKADGNKGSEFITKALKSASTLNIPLIVFCLLFYFLGGYLMYSSLFAAVGAAVDSETEVQQFMFPITIPIILSFIFAQFVINDPDGSMAFWLSIFPFTSPIIMMVRVPFGVPAWQLILSMVLMVLGFLGTVWIAARIYRVGILMYGKKVSYRELSKWIFYKG